MAFCKGVLPLMINIAICDDETDTCIELENVLIDIFSEKQVEQSIDIFSTGEELCRQMEAGSYYNLIFLDIEFAKHESNGVEVGRRIRDAMQNHSVSIVYISREKEYAFQLFEIRPLNFLLKPLENTAIEKTVQTFFNISGHWSEEFSYKVGRDTFKVKVQDIVYIESRQKKIIIFFADGTTDEFYGALKDIYPEKLKRFDFLFIHASYAVNFNYISAIRYDQLRINNCGVTLPISQSRRNEIREQYCMIMKRRRV